MIIKKALAAAMLLGAIAASGCTTSQSEYEVGQAVLKTDPDIRRTITADCIKDIDNDSAAERANMAAFMNVPVSRVSSTFCNRLIKAVATTGFPMRTSPRRTAAAIMRNSSRCCWDAEAVL